MHQDLSALLVPMTKSKAKPKAPKVKLPNGVILNRLISDIDNQTEIVTIAIFSGITNNNEPNTKTGKMVQLYHLVADQAPLDVIRSGDDSAICGDCPLSWTNTDKPFGSCYVNVGRAPSIVWNQFQKGAYPDFKTLPKKQQRQLKDLMITHGVRFGAYGDPASDLKTLWDITSFVSNWTGYTHTWKSQPAHRSLAPFLMASIDTLDDYQQAKSLGYRTFRHDKSGMRLTTELQCPENTKGIQCADCGLCAGTFGTKSKKDIVVERL